MATNKEYEDAAKKRPGNRTVAEQALVDKAKNLGMTNIKNLDHEAERDERYNW